MIILEGFDEAVTSSLLKGGSLGNVLSQILRVFTLGEMKRIVSKIF